MQRFDSILKLPVFHKLKSYVFLHVISKMIHDTILNHVCNVDDRLSSVPF